MAADVAERSDALRSRVSRLLSSCVCTYHILRVTYLSSVNLEATKMYATKSIKIESGLDDAATSSDTGRSGSPLHRTAAREFYDTPELRQIMLGLLKGRELKRFMRVERKCMHDVSKELYHTMDYAHVLFKMTTAAVSETSREDAPVYMGT